MRACMRASVRASVRARNVCMGGYIYCTVAVQFAG